LTKIHAQTRKKYPDGKEEAAKATNRMNRIAFGEQDRKDGTFCF